MPYLIDTDVVIDHLANIPDAQQLLEKLTPEGIAISMITYMEAYQGVVRSPYGRDACAIFFLLEIWSVSLPGRSASKEAKIVPATFACVQSGGTIARVRQEKKSEMTERGDLPSFASFASRSGMVGKRRERLSAAGWWK